MSDTADRHILTALAGPIAGAMYTGGDPAARHHAWAVALHEAAHAAVATALGIRLEAVSIIPANGALGHCRYHGEATGMPPRSDASSALCILWLSRGCPGWRETRRHLRRFRRQAEALVRADLYPIHRLAEALRARRELAGEEAEQILAAARRELAVGSLLAPFSSR